MKKVLAGIIIALAAVFIYNSWMKHRREQEGVLAASQLIQEQIKNVSKLIVTEGHFSEVYNYADSKELFGTVITADKKALVVVNAEVQVVYDLNELAITIDETAKTLRVDTIPEAELKIHPEFQYYDITSDYFNPFGPEDYNKIKTQAKTNLREKLENSKLVSNAKNRLLAELSKLLLTTDRLGWTLVYEEKTIKSKEQFLLLD